MSDQQPSEEAKTCVLPKIVHDCSNKVVICVSSCYDWNRFVAVHVDRFFADLEQLQPGHKSDVVATFCKGVWHGEPDSIHSKFDDLVDKWFKVYAKDTNTEHGVYGHPYLFVHGTQSDDY